MLAQFIIKVSKLCNLRCSYCYEFPELARPDRMSLEQLERMFELLAKYYRASPHDRGLRFIWHGGEPLLQPPEFYRRIFAAQRRQFGERKIVNDVQTNLTVLDDDRIELLKNGFNGVGVSNDIFGNLRLNVAGKPTQTRVFENMQRLQEAGIAFGCITVLTRRNISEVDRIFRFYEAIGCSFRLLPLFKGAEPDQHLGYEVSGQQVLDALCRVADLWLASATKIRIEPISDQLGALLLRRSQLFRPRYYDRRRGEQVVLVNTNGDLYSQADAFAPGRAWGNIFETPFDELMQCEARARSVLDAEKRMASTCLKCEYFGACDGFAVAEDNRLYPDTLRDGRMHCVVERGLFLHLERRLREAEARLGPRFRERFADQPEAPKPNEPLLEWAEIPV